MILKLGAVIKLRKEVEQEIVSLSALRDEKAYFPVDVEIIKRGTELESYISKDIEIETQQIQDLIDIHAKLTVTIGKGNTSELTYGELTGTVSSSLDKLSLLQKQLAMIKPYVNSPSYKKETSRYGFSSSDSQYLAPTFSSVMVKKMYVRINHEIDELRAFIDYANLTLALNVEDYERIQELLVC